MKDRSQPEHTNNPFPITTTAIGFMSAIAIVLGIIFILFLSKNTPISKAEATPYSGEYVECITENDYRAILFADGTEYQIYPHVKTHDLQSLMRPVEKGTTLYLLIDPHNDYIAEIKTKDQEILSFDQTQNGIPPYNSDHIVIGILSLILGIALLAFVILMRKNFATQQKRAQALKNSPNVAAIRRADTLCKYKTLLEASVDGYKICYRRVKTVNELVVNGCVYDEYKALIEFDHSLSAKIDGHTIKAGYYSEYSYIAFDGNRIAQKKRLI